MAGALTRERAVWMQDELIEGFSRSDFQSRLDSIWKDKSLGPTDSAQAREDACFEVQGPILAKYGFEASRLGLSRSIEAFAPELTADPEIASKGEYLRWLADPALRAKQSVQPWKPVAEAGGGRDNRTCILKAATEETEAITPGPNLATADALALEEALLRKFSSGEFRRKVLQAWHASGRSPAAKRKGAYDVALGFLCVTVRKYGFDSSPEGVEQCFDVLSHDLVAEPDVGIRLAVVRWLIDPGMQLSVQSPEGLPGREFHVHVQAACEYDCRISVEAMASVWDVKNRLMPKTRILPLAQRLIVAGVELLDSDLLCGCVPAGVVEATLIAREPEVAEWLQKVQRETEVYWENRKERKVDCLAEAPHSLLANREFMLPAIQEDIRVLEFAAPEVCADRDIILAAVKQQGNALRFAAPELQGDRELVRAAILQDGWAIQYAAPELQGDLELALLTIMQDGCALDLIKPELSLRKDVALQAVRRTGGVLRVLSPEQRSDREICLAAVREDGEALMHVAPELQADRGIVLAACRRNSDALRFAAPILQADHDIVLAAVTRNGEALRWACEELQNDRELVLTAVRNNGIVLSIIKQDAEIVATAIRRHATALSYVEPNFLKVAYAALAHGKDMGDFDEVHDNGRVFVLRWPPSGAMLHHFEALKLDGWPKAPSVADIRISYRRLALEHHPDKHPENPQAATSKFQSIHEAYSAIMQLFV